LPMFPPNHLFGEQVMPREAVNEVHGWLKKGLRVVDADLSGYFDTIPHGQWMKSLGRRISDGESPVPSRRC
jgi:RNA-directed DNA polymerase